MEQLRPDTAPVGRASRRSFIAGALAGTAAGALGGGVPRARGDAVGDSSPRHYSLPKRAYRIDLHAHFIPPAYRPFLGNMVPWSVEAHLEFKNTWGIQKSVISAPPLPPIQDTAQRRAIARAANEYGRQLLDEHGDRFGIHVALPLPDVAGSIEELGYAIDTLGLDGGTMLFSHYEGVYVGDPAFEPLYAELDRRGSVVWIHPIYPVEEPVGPFRGHVLEFPFETTRAATLIMYNGLLERYPNIKWQLSHGGGALPYILARLAFGQEIPFYAIPPRPQGPFTEAKKFIYDTALAFSDEQLVAMDELTGAPQIAFGTDFPFTPWLFAPDARQRAPWWTDDLPTTDGDPQPALSRVFTRPERMRIERTNAQQLFPDLVSAT